MILKGKAHKYGANIDTDAIIPARYLNLSEPPELAMHCMEDIDAEFLKRVERGDIIIAETNFGCGSSREHAPVALKAAGVSCVIAKTFARIFFRNAINIGLPLLESPEAVEGIGAGDTACVTCGQHLAAETRPLRRVFPRLEIVEQTVADFNKPELRHTAGGRPQVVGNYHLVRTDI